MRRGDPAELMKARRHGTCTCAPPAALRWGVDGCDASSVCCHNRHGAEPRGSFETNQLFVAEARRSAEITFYDSVSGRPLFIAPGVGRSLQSFLDESSSHGWPSFRDDEVVWEHARVLPDGETCSIDGVHVYDPPRCRVVGPL